MGKKRHVLRNVLALLLAAACMLVTACGSSGQKGTGTSSRAGAQVIGSGGETLRILSGSENKELEPLLEECAKKNHVTLEMYYKGSLDIMHILETDSSSYDAVWPANSLWLNIGDKKHVVKHTESISVTPVVLGMKKSLAESLGFTDREVSVQDILDAVTDGKFTFCMTSATQSNSGASAYIGFLYARKGVRLRSLIEGGAQEGGRRAGTENVASAVGMAAALKEAAAGMAANDARLRPLRDKLIAGLREIPHSALNGDAVHRLPGNVNFCFEGIEGESLLLLLDDRGICASSGSACTSGSLDPSHVLLAIGRVHDVAHGSLRLTLGEDATEEQVDYLIQNVKEVVEYLRGFSPIWRDLMAGKTQFIL